MTTTTIVSRGLMSDGVDDELPPLKTRDDAEVEIIRSTIGTIAYILRSTGESSEKFGPCMVCGKRVSDVHTQRKRERISEEDGGGWSVVGTYQFGHRECLVGVR